MPKVHLPCGKIITFYEQHCRHLLRIPKETVVVDEFSGISAEFCKRLCERKGGVGGKGNWITIHQISLFQNSFVFGEIENWSWSFSRFNLTLRKLRVTLWNREDERFSSCSFANWHFNCKLIIWKDQQEMYFSRKELHQPLGNTLWAPLFSNTFSAAWRFAERRLLPVAGFSSVYT